MVLNWSQVIRYVILGLSGLGLVLSVLGVLSSLFGTLVFLPLTVLIYEECRKPKARIAIHDVELERYPLKGGHFYQVKGILKSVGSLVVTASRGFIKVMNKNSIVPPIVVIMTKNRDGTQTLRREEYEFDRAFINFGRLGVTDEIELRQGGTVEFLGPKGYTELLPSIETLRPSHRYELYELVPRRTYSVMIQVTCKDRQNTVPTRKKIKLTAEDRVEEARNG